MRRRYIDTDNAQMKYTYEVCRPDGGWKRHFTEQEIERIRPIAEVLCSLDGNSFWNDSYVQYLPEADALYRANPGAYCWHKEAELRETNSAVADAYDKYKSLIALSSNDR